MSRMLIGASTNLAALVGLLGAAVIPSGLTTAHGDSGRHSAPVKLHEHISSDGSGVLRLSGVGTPLGRFAGRGTIVSSTYDPNTKKVRVDVTATFIAHNGDKLYASVTVSADAASGEGTETLLFTGGTGRFEGCTGHAKGRCEAVLNPANPLIFECDGRTTGTLHLDD
jgi:hypothetical protein